MARAGAAMFVAGGGLALLSLAVPHWPVRQEFAASAVAAVAVVAGICLYASARYFVPWVAHLLLAAAAVQVAVGIQFVGPGAGSVSAGGMYVWMAIYAFYFFSWRAALVHLGVMGLAYGVGLAFLDEPAAPAIWLLAMGTAAVAGTSVGVLAQQLREAATSDRLTGLLNRAAWEDSLVREIARTTRRDDPLCVAMLDLDDFKALNDTSGHHAGDLHLRRLAAAWTAAVRGNDVLARYGGDEFALLLPDCDAERALAVLRRMRLADEAGMFSAGVAQWDGVEGPSEFVKRADMATYEAKHSGRNRTVLADA